MANFDNRFLGRRRLDDYEILEEISSDGCSSIVYRARDKKTGEIVAVKHLLYGLCEETLTEIRILKSLPRHPSIVEFKHLLMEPRGGPIAVVMEYVETDLQRLMAARKTKPFALMEIKQIMKQLLEGVRFLHDEGVMHRDLKPDNILINGETELKICDFGLSERFGGAAAEEPCGPCVGAVWYRAPELLMESSRYSCAVDMWAVGCIMAELVLQRVLFRGWPAAADRQLACVNQVITPAGSLLRQKMATTASFSVMNLLTPAGVDLLHGLLAYEPEKRMTAREALNHAWFDENSFVQNIWFNS